MDKSPDSSVSVGRYNQKHSDFEVYHVEYVFEDNSIYDGLTCSSYEKYETTYGECITTSIGEDIKHSYGCQDVPLWINFTCSSDITNHLDNLDPLLLQQSFSDIEEITNNFQIKTMKRCKTPCKRLFFILFRHNIILFSQSFYLVHVCCVSISLKNVKLIID